MVFSYNFYGSHEDFPYMPVYTEYFESVEAPDDQTVVITLTEPIPNLESQLVFLYILPEHIWAEHDTPEGATAFENEQLIGSGPFKLREYRQGEFATLDAVKDHPTTPPKVDGVVFQTFDNQDALVQALVTGQVDMITELPNTAVPVLRNAENVQLVIGAPLSPEVADIIPNQVSEENCPPDDGVCSGHPALRDVRVRQALAHATDKQKIIDVALLGLGTPGLTLIPDGLGVWYNDTIEDYAFDIDEANRILDEAGYLDTDGDGVRQMPDGSNPLNLRIFWPSDSSTAPARGRAAGRVVEGSRRHVAAAGTGPRRADLGLLPDLRLRHHHLGLGLGPRSWLPARRPSDGRDTHRQQRDRLFQPRVRRAVCAAGYRAGPGQAPGDHLADAADPAR